MYIFNNSTDESSATVKIFEGSSRRKSKVTSCVGGECSMCREVMDGLLEG